jgi:SPP1 family predicted phage head-tail adaptor
MFPLKEFDQRLTFQRESTERNVLNEPVGGWVEAFKVWGRVRPLSQRDDMGADQPHAVATYVVTTRKCCAADLSALSSMRVLWTGGAYYISGEPIKIDGGRYLQLRMTSQRINDV